MPDMIVPAFSPARTAALPADVLPARSRNMADLLVAYLEQINVDFVFGVPGGAIEPIFDAIARLQRNGGNIHPVVARHEAGAVLWPTAIFGKPARSAFALPPLVPAQPI